MSAKKDKVILEGNGEQFEPELVPPPKMTTKRLPKIRTTGLAIGILLSALYIWSYISARIEKGKEQAFVKSIGVMTFIIITAICVFLKKVPAVVGGRFAVALSFGIVIALTGIIATFVAVYRIYENSAKEKVKT